MKIKKGFSLAECVIAVTIVMLISFSLVHACLITISNSNKTNAIQLVENECLNIAKILKQAEIEESGAYAPKKLENALSEYLCVNFDLSENNLGKSETICFDDKGNNNTNGKIKITLTFEKDQSFLRLIVGAEFDEKILKEKTVLFEKYVREWSV